MKTKDAERQAKYRKTGRTFTVTIRDPQAVEALQVQATLYGGITAAITRLLVSQGFPKASELTLSPPHVDM